VCEVKRCINIPIEIVHICTKCEVSKKVIPVYLTGTLNKSVNLCDECFSSMTNVEIKDFIREQDGRR